MESRPTDRSPVLLVLAACSGATALGYEVLYVRHLTTLLGDMLWVHAGMLSAFLVGVGAGSRWAHRAWGRLWMFEVATGLYAIALPFLTGLLGASSGWASVTGSAVPTVVVAVLLSAAPALAIGFALPLFAGYLRASRSGASVFKGLYTVYNAGALVGIVAVELALVEVLGVRGALIAFGGVNIAIGAVLRWMGAPRAPTEVAGGASRHVLVGLVAGSFASALFQMHLLRSTYMVFGPHRENFALTLAVVLAGVALGAPLVRVLRLDLARALTGAGILGVGAWLAFGAVAGLATGGDAPGFAARGVLTAALGLAPMAFFGALVPAALRSEEGLARASGTLLWVSGWANAAGYLTYVLVLHQALPGGGVLASVGVVCALGAWIAGRSGEGTRRSGLPGPLATVGVAAIVSFTWSDPDFYLAAWPGAAENAEVVTIRRGGESATLVREPGREWVTYNGHPSIEVQAGGVVNQGEVLSGVVPALTAPSLENALVLGLGTGITGGVVARLFDHTDVVEINPAFLAMEPRMRHVNSGIDQNPAASIHLADGRTFLNGAQGRYDAILNSIPTPTYYSASKIYTLEFYERVREALVPGGVFVTWLAAVDLTEEGLELVLRTLAQVFEECDLRVLRGDYVMATCSDAPLRGMRSVSEISGFAHVRPLLEVTLGATDPDTFFEAQRVSEGIGLGSRRSPAGPLNTDDRPRLEFVLSGAGTEGETNASLFWDEPERFGIRWLPGAADPERWVEEARVRAVLAPDAFNAMIAPAIRADSVLVSLWEGRAPGP